jgi:hypothetical protein
MPISIVAKNLSAVADQSWKVRAGSCRYACPQMSLPAGRRVVLGGKLEWPLYWRGQFARPGELPANNRIERTRER